MSSILDALEKLESRRAAGESPEPPRQRPRNLTPLLAGAALAAFAAGIGLTVAWMRPAPAPPTMTAPPPTIAPAPVAAAPRAAEQPWAEVITPPAARRAAEETAPNAALALATPPPPTADGTTSPPVAPRPTGAPSVRVSFLVYSSVPERRSVALAIDEGGLVTLQEGQEASGLSVVQIQPDGVELTWQGQSFTVRARN